MVPDACLKRFAEAIHYGFQLAEVNPYFNVLTVFWRTVGVAEEI